MSGIIDSIREAKQEIINSSQASGPVYPNTPLRWGQQIFEREIAPAGNVTCANPVHVGKTSGALDVMLVASHSNSSAVVFAQDSTVTLTLLGSESRDGEYRAEGPSICVTAPEEGISAEPDALACRFAIGERSAWVKVKLAFTGEISGGKVDCCLGYLPR